MTVEFNGPVYAIDYYAIRAFVEIINIIVHCDDPAQLHKRLLTSNIHPSYRSLSGYYKWEFDDYGFSLFQRIEFRSERLFDDMILKIHYRTMRGTNKISH